MGARCSSFRGAWTRGALLGCTVVKQTGIFMELATMPMAGMQGEFERISSSA